MVGKRSAWKKSAPGYWCPVCGGIEPGETEQMAVIREVWEEVGLRVSPVRKLCEFDTADGTGRIHWWLAKFHEGQAALKNDEHSEIRWVTFDELCDLQPLFPEDISVYRSLHNEATKANLRRFE